VGGLGVGVFVQATSGVRLVNFYRGVRTILLRIIGTAVVLNWCASTGRRVLMVVVVETTTVVVAAAAAVAVAAVTIAVAAVHTTFVNFFHLGCAFLPSSFVHLL
jgi:hypothetical protein